MSLVAYYTRATLRRHWRSYAAVALLLGLTGGLSLFAIAGARRTQSSYPRFLRSANTSTLGLTYGGLNTARSTPRLPHCRPCCSRGPTSPSTRRVLVNGQPDFSQDPEPVGTPDGRYFEQDRLLRPTVAVRIRSGPMRPRSTSSPPRRSGIGSASDSSWASTPRTNSRRRVSSSTLRHRSCA